MTIKLKSGVVTLKLEARRASTLMIEELRQIDENIKIDHSKLVSFLITDYRENYFRRNKEKISNLHRDSKKKIRNKLSNLSPQQLEAVSKYIEKIEPKQT